MPTLQYFLCGVAAALLLGSAQAADTRPKSLVKWVDENGQVHYSDTLPPESLSRERKELSRQGLELRTIAPPKSREQLFAERQVEEELRAREERDRVLRESYNSVDEILAMRDRRIAVLDAEIHVSQALMAKLKQQLQSLVTKAAALERSGRPVPETDRRNIQQTRQQIAQNQAFVQQKQQEQEALRVKCAADIQRYRELQAADTTATAP